MRELQARAKLLCKAAAPLVLLCVIGLPGQAQAQVEVVPSSWVDGNVTYNPGDDKYFYEFTVHNTTVFPGADFGFGDDDDDAVFVGDAPLVVDWELPLMVGPGQDWTDVVSDISSPISWPIYEGQMEAVSPTPEHTWYYEVIDPITGYIWETNDPDFSAGDDSAYYADPSGPYGEYSWTWTKEADPVWQDDNDVYGPTPDQWETPDYLIHWYTPDIPDFSPKAPIWPGQYLYGFSFMSDYSAGNAPYMDSWLDLPPTIGDPPFPAGSLPTLPGPTVPGGIIPLPAALPMALIAMAGMGGVGYLRRRFAR